MTTNYLIDGVDTDALFVRKDLFRHGNLWTWGNAGSGLLGNNSVTGDQSSPIQTVSGGTNWLSITAANDNVSAIKSDGTLWLWGDNYYGQIGDGTVGMPNSKSSPVQTITGGTNWKQSSVGSYLSAAIKTDGTLWAWGANFAGQVGNNVITTRVSSPVQTISGGSNWKLVSCGLNYMSAIKTDGTLWTWGQNTYGQLGDNTTTDKSSPVQTISLGTSWKQVSNSYYTTAAIKTDGTLWLWGNNSYGQMGDNTTAHKSSPVQTVAGGTDWKQVATGRYNTTAIKTNGTLWLWGNNNMGQLGDNTVTIRLSPVQTISGGSNWKQVAIGWQQTTAIKTDGTLWVWGRNSSGELGDNTRTNRSSPVQTVMNGTNWKQVSCAGVATMAINDNNIL